MQGNAMTEKDVKNMLDVICGGKAMKEKNVQIPLSLWNDLVYLLGNISEFVPDDILQRVEEKQEAMERRELFGKYKAEPFNTAEREEYRRQYLDKAGIMLNHRSAGEISEFHDFSENYLRGMFPKADDSTFSA